MPKGYPNIGKQVSKHSKSKAKHSSVQVIRLGLFLENGISRVQNIDSALVQLGDGRIKDMKFMDDDVLLVLWEFKGKNPLKCSIRPILIPTQG